MRKLSAFFIVLVAVAYFFLFPEDHAQELPYDGLTVGEPVEQAPVSQPLEQPGLEVPDLLAAEGERREEVEVDPDDLVALADDLGLTAGLAFEDAEPVALPGDTPPLEGSVPAGVPITGRVVDASGQSIPGVRVRVEHPYLPEVLGASDPDGAFRLMPAELRGELVLATTAWVLLGGRLTLESGTTEGYLVVVAQPVILQGVIVDESGHPIEGARLHGFAPSDTLVPFGTPALPLDHEVQHGYSNARGRFRLGPLPQLAGTRVEVLRTGFEPTIVPLPEDPRAPLTIVLAASR